MNDLFGNEAIRALSWKQPYAELMFHHKIETRTYPTNVRGKVLICASKTGYNHQQVLSISGTSQVERIKQILSTDTISWFQNSHSGFAVGIGELFNCRPMKKEDEAKCFVEYYLDLWCWEFRSVQRIKPIPWKGSQGWSFLTDEQKAMIHPLVELTNI